MKKILKFLAKYFPYVAIGWFILLCILAVFWGYYLTAFDFVVIFIAGYSANSLLYYSLRRSNMIMDRLDPANDIKHGI